MSAITTHVLDISSGRPAVGVPVRLWIRTDESDGWKLIGQGRTDDDGRLKALLAPSAALDSGTYRLTFNTEAYFNAQSIEGFYPEVTVIFKVLDERQHYHVPLLLSPFGYSTYRGS